MRAKVKRWTEFREKSEKFLAEYTLLSIYFYINY